MKEFYNSQTPPSEEPRSTSTNTLQILDTQAITALRCLRTLLLEYPIVEVIADLLPVKKGDPGHTVIPISIGMLADRTLRFSKGILKNLHI